jgi:hypothetical protein
MGAVSNQKALRAAARKGRPRAASPDSSTEAPQRRDDHEGDCRRNRAGPRRYVPAAFEGSDATVLVGGETAFNKAQRITTK